MTENLELREWIAVNVMGLEVRKERDHNFIQERYRLEYFSRGSGRPSGQIVGMDGGDYWRELPPYELTWNDAALVVEAMRARGWIFSMKSYMSNSVYPWGASFAQPFSGVVQMEPGDFAPLAICQAAKAAIEATQ